ncbi:DUF6081 family protein [Streptomyces cellulosae]|jgi:hypothetical protein|uniref:DUF6081 family protein n=1 Tax=Streptomyces thermocarboxydus TaxID=59299 RepID=A0ABU3JDJ8_9ACTN|nr:hypothetical protein [Streptomyces sp. McG7]MBT2904661.1 hypothetical protein [Streptomyces sp. McG8]MCX4475751.1 DUF6081 family protein [Streptomyces cellulosae]MDT6972607.1 DUF6081 family protein [Streptomyces thermocarboxydus]MYQ31302.1 hypothetical protein [Streptomyces sp. SID4956]MYW51691.1 hypothetical protein [Streptomyces sp. SID8376]THC59504.1 hypothetical protein E7X38_02355 [Streptomyces sp. Akac8]
MARKRILSTLLLTAALGATALPSASASAPAGASAGSAPSADRPYKVVWDDFRHGLRTSGPGAPWFQIEGGGYRADDGIVSTSRHGLHVKSSGVNPRTGEPAFVQTIPQHTPSGAPGSGDHAKWLVYTSHTSSHGYPGFDAVPGLVLSCETTMSGRTYGTAGHPFGKAVKDPEDDLRLASVMLNTIDNETSTAFDFVITNKRIYAFYGRPTFGRATLGNYASFANTVPLMWRKPGDTHRLKISYDRSAGVVRWLIDGREVLKVDRIGHRLGRDTLTLDEGGVEGRVAPRQLNCGMGLLNLLDGSYPTGKGLARLSVQTNYYEPRLGEPHEETFVDEQSTESSRLFGQGGEFRMKNLIVSSTRARR